ncbi:MAG: hypothetical protein ABIH46_10795 [Chloroflexota bacterium]
MGKTQSVKSCKTSQSFARAVRSQGGYIEHGRRHDIARAPSGAGRVAIPRHKGELAPGMRSSISRVLLALGFSIIVCLPTGLLIQLIIGLQEVYG